MTSVSAYLTFKEPRAAMAFYEKALDAEIGTVMDGPGETVMHAEMQIGETTLMLSGEWEGMAVAPKGLSSVNFVMNVQNADESYRKALDHGMTSVMEPEDQFWGDRSASAMDPFGYRWSFMHRVEDVSPEEVQRRAAEYAAKMAS